MDIQSQINNSSNLKNAKKDILDKAFSKLTLAGNIPSVQNTGSVNSAAINLNGVWESYYNDFLRIGSDKGEYTIIQSQSGSDVLISGSNFKSKSRTKWENVGVGKIFNKYGTWFIEIFWTDINSNSKEYTEPHWCIIEIAADQKSTVTKGILHGERFSYGTWTRVENSDAEQSN